MRILILSNKFPYPPKDGGVIAKLAMIKGLHAQGHDLTVMALNTSKHFTDVKTLPQEISKLACFIDVYVNTDLSAKDALFNFLFSSMPYNAVRFITDDFKSKLQELLTKETFDIIQLETLYMCPYIDIVRKYSNAKIAYRAHNIESEIWKRVENNEGSFLKKIYIKNLAKRIDAFERSYINKYDLLLPITPKDESNLNTMGNTKPSLVCPTGIVADDYIPETNAHYQTIFHLGGLDWPPNQQGLVWFIDSCLPLLKQQIDTVSFHIGGRNAPEWLLDKFKKHPEIVFDGEVENAHDYIRSQGIMIAPLLAGSGMRIKIIEGMALGKAIVATSIGAEGIHYSDKENILISDDAQGFAESIAFLMKNGRERQRIAENAVTFACEEFDNTMISARLSAFYKDNLLKEN